MQKKLSKIIQKSGIQPFHFLQKMMSFIYVSLIGIILSLVIYIVFNGLVLWILTHVLEFKEKKYSSLVVSSIYGFTLFVLSLIALLIPTLLNNVPYTIFVFLVSLLVLIYAIKNYYITDFKWAAFACGIIFGLDLLIGFLFGSVLALIAGMVRIPPY